MRNTLKKYKRNGNRKKLTLSKKVKDLTLINSNNSYNMLGGSNITNFIKALNELSAIMKAKGEVFRSIAYIKAINELKKYMSSAKITDIGSANELKALQLPNIGKTIIQKYEEFLNTGTLEAITKEKNNPINIFTNIYSIGPVKAKELVESKNILTLEQLKERQSEIQENDLPLLNKKQQIGLKYYNELLKRIPREEIEEFKSLLETNFKETITENNELEENHKFEFVGSYRRGAQNSGDIDVIFTSYNNNKQVFKKFIEKLHSKKIILEILSNGEVKCLSIGTLLKESATPRRIDFLYAPQQEYAFTLLYFTGSKEFNTAMRQHALNVNLTLSEHGFYRLSTTSNVKQEKIENILFKTERNIFDFLYMEYKEPHERIDEHSIILTLPIAEIKTKLQAQEAIVSLLRQLDKPNKSLELQQTIEGEAISISTNYYRELVYNLEHCIHHQALIKVALLQLNHVTIDENFGVARSTIEYRKQCAQ